MRIVLWLGVLLCVVLTAGLYVVSFPEQHPDKMLVLEHEITEFLSTITLPIKTAKLALREPDAALKMPVYGSTIAKVTDTWHTARGTDRVHEGQDIFAPKGTPVFSATYGYVRRIGINELGGNIVFVNGAGGRRYYYAHLDRIAEGLYVGQEVTTDTVLGFVGNTGNAATTPSHLHFGMYEGRKALNPYILLRDR